MSVHNNPRIATDNLFIYLDAANEKSFPKYGTNKWGDLSGFGNHFTMIGNLTNVNGYFEFTGDINKYFVLNNIIHPELEITVEMWVLPNSATSGDALYGFVSNSSIGSHSVNNQTNLTITGPISSSSSNLNIVDNKWKHIVRTSSRSVRSDMTAGTENLYVNGELNYTTILDPEIKFGSFGFVILGQRSNINKFIDPAYAFAGKIAIFKLYTRVLTAKEIEQNYKALRGRFFI